MFKPKWKTMLLDVSYILKKKTNHFIYLYPTPMRYFWGFDAITSFHWLTKFSNKIMNMPILWLNAICYYIDSIPETIIKLLSQISNSLFIGKPFPFPLNIMSYLQEWSWLFTILPIHILIFDNNESDFPMTYRWILTNLHF